MDLDRLKKQVHQLEVESRVLLHENERYTKNMSYKVITSLCWLLRLSEELSQELSIHATELVRIKREGEEAIQRVLAEPPRPKNYADKIQELHELVRKNYTSTYSWAIPVFLQCV